MRKTKLIMCVLPLVLLAGCGTKDTIDVSIKDGQVTTVITVDRNSTVEDILDEAELTVADGDDVTPALQDAVSDGVSIVISRQNSVSIAENGVTEKTVTIMGGTVQDVLDKEDITLGEYDLINHDPGAFLTDGMVIDITRRIAVSLNVDGETEQIITSAKTVSELLEEQNISVGDKDRLSMARDAAIRNNDTLTIERVDVRKITETEAVAYDTETEYSDDMYADESSVKQEGSDGEKQVTYSVTYVDGKESDRKLVEEKITKDPVNEIILQGTKQREVVDSGKTVVSKTKNYDCDGSGHGWYTITYSDGSVEYEDF